MTFATPVGAPLQRPVMGVVIHRDGFGTLGGVNTRMTGFDVTNGPHYTGSMRCTLRRLPFLPGQFTLDLWLGDGPGDNDALFGYLSFEIENADVYGTGRTPFAEMGVAFFDPEWQFHPNEESVLKA